MVARADDRHVLAGEWEYIDSTGAVVPLTLDEQGNGHYEWKEGRFETHRLIGRTWSRMCSLLQRTQGILLAVEAIDRRHTEYVCTLNP